MPEANALTPWVLSTHEIKPVAHWREVGRFNSKAGAEREAIRLRLPNYRIAFAYVPVGVAENESSNGG